MMSYAEFSDLKGKKILQINGLEKGSSEIEFVCSDNTRYKMFYDDYGYTFLEDIVGNYKNLLNTPILMADESSNEESIDPEYESCAEDFKWTFYKLATIKGYVTLRWFCSSNGWYSEDVIFCKTSRKRK